MDDLSRKFRSLDWKSLQKSARKMQASTASALKDLVMTDLENKTRSATADTPWGASGSDLMAIAQGTYSREDYALIMSIVWQRLASTRWRCVYKALEVLKFLAMHGTARCLEEGRAALGHLESLRSYHALEAGRDVGERVRNRAAHVCELLSDDTVLEQERERSKALRAKLQGGMNTARMGGLSSDDYRFERSDNGKFSTSNMAVDSGATHTFKGYGDDDASGDGERTSYDDEPNGKFASQVGASASLESKAIGVDDLLGGNDAVEQTGTGFSNDDDDLFNAGAGEANSSETAVDDMFGALSLVPCESPSSGSSNAIATSLLVQQLAAKQTLQQREAQGPQMPMSHTKPVVESQASLDMENHMSSVSATSDSGVENCVKQGIGEENGEAEEARPYVRTSNVKRAPLRREPVHEDPFGDLMDSAKKSGVV